MQLQWINCSDNSALSLYDWGPAGTTVISSEANHGLIALATTGNTRQSISALGPTESEWASPRVVSIYSLTFSPFLSSDLDPSCS